MSSRVVRSLPRRDADTGGNEGLPDVPAPGFRTRVLGTNTDDQRRSQASVLRDLLITARTKQ